MESRSGRRRLTVISADSGDPALLEAWRGLQADEAVATPFLTWQWASAMAAVPEVSSTVRVLRVTEGNRTIGLLPVETWRDDRGLRVLGLAGGRWAGPDHVDVVARPSDAGAVAAAVVRSLRRSLSWDLLDLEGLASGGALTGALASRFPAAVHLSDQVVVAPYLDLRPGDPALLLPSRNLRQQVSRGLRIAEREGGGLSVCTDPDEVVDALGVLMHLHNRRFGSRSQVFATQDRRTFHLGAAARLAAEGMARVYRLRVGDGDAALLYALRLGTTLYYYQMGMEPELGSSPGRTLLGQVALSAAAEGLAEFDLLRGDHEFKLRFASGTRDDRRVRVLRPTPRVGAVAGRRLTTGLTRAVSRRR